MKRFASFQRYPCARNVVALSIFALTVTPASHASSHREAPGITKMPKTDATDFYMFNSYEPGREGFVTIVANYQPFQTPYGGPNFFNMDSDAVYQIHIDNTADAREDLTFSFRFTTQLRDTRLNIGGRSVSIPLINSGSIGPGAADTANLNVVESYTIDLIAGDRYDGQSRPILNAADNARVFAKPVDNIGAKSIPNYETYARNHIYEIKLPNSNLTGRVFVGQRDDPFQINLGEVFDLVNTNPVGPPAAEADVLAENNVSSIVIEIPAAYLRRGAENVIGGWTTASLPQLRILRDSPTFPDAGQEQGRYIQVSRLGMPLVNELVIGIKDKNRFNASQPTGDAQFLTYVTNPTLPALLNVLFQVTPPCLPRNDLVQVFLTGVPGLNQPANVRPAEMLRLNTNTNPAAGGTPAKPKGQQNALGVLGGDNAGFPNGRRPGDDVVDIELRAVIGALLPPTCAPNGNLPLTDGAFISDQDFDAVFPYLTSPTSLSPN